MEGRQIAENVLSVLSHKATFIKDAWAKYYHMECSFERFIQGHFAEALFDAQYSYSVPDAIESNKTPANISFLGIDLKETCQINFGLSPESGYLDLPIYGSSSEILFDVEIKAIGSRHGSPAGVDTGAGSSRIAEIFEKMIRTNDFFQKGLYQVRKGKPVNGGLLFLCYYQQVEKNPDSDNTWFDFLKNVINAVNVKMQEWKNETPRIETLNASVMEIPANIEFWHWWENHEAGKEKIWENRANDLVILFPFFVEPDSSL